DRPAIILRHREGRHQRSGNSAENVAQDVSIRRSIFPVTGGQVGSAPPLGFRAVARRTVLLKDLVTDVDPAGCLRASDQNKGREQGESGATPQHKKGVEVASLEVAPDS